MSKISDDSKPKVRANYIDQLVSQRLKIRRILRGVSQQELGNAIGVSVQQVQKYEKAANRISSGKLHIIATFLDVPVSYFFEKTDGNNDASYEEDSENIKPYDHTNILDITSGITEKELISIIRAFSEVSDTRKRKKIIELIKAIS